MEKYKKIFFEALMNTENPKNIDYENMILGNQNFGNLSFEEIGLNSIDIISFVVNLEELLSIQIVDQGFDFSSVKTLGKLIEAIELRKSEI